MSNELAIQDEKDLIKALKNSVYIDASDESIKLVIAYCKALKLDPMSKPVHLARFGGKEVVLPGIGLLRIRADRTGTYLGLSEPEFGETITEQLGNSKITYPFDCKIRIKKRVGDEVAVFTGHAIWKETYVTNSDKITPSSFWSKRPYSQLAKCAESDALRKAYSDIAGHAPVYEDMHEMHDTNMSDAELAVKNAANKLKHDLLAKQPLPLFDQVKKVITEHEITDEEITRWLEKAGIESLKDLSVEQMQAIVNKYGVTNE